MNAQNSLEGFLLIRVLEEEIYPAFFVNRFRIMYT